MFGLLKRKKPHEQEARDLFEHVHAQSRSSVFYEHLGVPDTTEGRFDMLALHMFMIMHILSNQDGAGDDLSQSLFDIAFEDIARGYREIGVGDMGLPKRMKKLMLGFNGSIHAYEEALGDDDALKEALRRNVYTLYTGAESDLSPTLDKMIVYIQSNIEYLQTQDVAFIMNGNLIFKNFDEI